MFIKKIVSIILVVLMVFTSISFITPTKVHAAGNTYYIDSVGGSDTNDGTSSGTPWQTLDKVNSVTFQPGDQVLFKAGSSWNGTLIPQGSGDSSNQIVFGRYGEGPRPIIAGAGARQTIKLYNVQYITIQDLELTNDAVTNETTQERDAITVYAEKIGILHRIKLLNMDIHDVDGYSDKNNRSKNAAIYLMVLDGYPMSGFDEMLIEGNNIHDIKVTGFYSNQNFNYWAFPDYWATNLKIRNNVFNRTGGDHIVLMNSNAGVVEYNVGYDAGINGVGYEYLVGMWSCYCTKDILFQYNEVARTHNELGSGAGDSQAFDVDYGASGTQTFQYNYTHDNEGGILLVMWDQTVSNIIYRYNISQNDGNFNCNNNTTFAVNVNYGTSKAYIYNNTVYNNTPRGITIRDNTSAHYYNNIFYSTVDYTYPSKPVFSNNCYYGHSATVNDANKVTANPLLVNPGTGADGKNTVDGYKLQTGSPCINAGMQIANNGGKDYWGSNSYNGRVDIGACEYDGEVYPTEATPSPLPMNSPVPTVTPVPPDFVNECENLSTFTSSGDSNTVIVDPRSSNRYYLQYNSDAAGDYIEFDVNVATAGTYNVLSRTKVGTDRGIYQLSIDGVNQGSPVDLYSNTTDVNAKNPSMSIGQVTFNTTGIKKIRFTVTGKNSSSTGYILALDTVAFDIPDAVIPTPTPTPITAAPSPVTGRFVKGINFTDKNLPVVIDGNMWLTQAQASVVMERTVEAGYVSYPDKRTGITNPATPFSPPLTGDTLTMVSNYVQEMTGNDLRIRQPLSNGTYDIYLWSLESWQDNYRSFDVSFEGTTTTGTIGSQKRGEWKKYGPYKVTVTDGELTMLIDALTGNICLSGMAIYESSFVKGVNFGKSGVSRPVVIDGNQWETLTSRSSNGNTAYGDANFYDMWVDKTQTSGYFNVISPPISGDMLNMVGTYLQEGNSHQFGVNISIPNGTYDTYLWCTEGYQDNFRPMNVKFEGIQLASNIAGMKKAEWKRYGPYTASVTDGALTVDFIPIGNSPGISGIALYKHYMSEVSNVVVTPGEGRLDVAWSDPADNALSEVEVSVEGHPEIAAVRVNKGVQAASVTGLNGGTEYTLRIKTMDALGTTSSGISVSGTPLGVPKTVTSVQAINITSVVGVAPVLPAAVVVGYSDNTTGQAVVTWENIAPAQYAAAGSFTLNGAVEGTDLQAVANVTIGRFFTILSNGALDRTSGIKAIAAVKETIAGTTHTGNEVVVFQLMKGSTPISIIAMENDITEEIVTAYFNISDFMSSLYTVKVFVFDVFNNDIGVPENLASPAILN